MLCGLFDGVAVITLDRHRASVLAIDIQTRLVPAVEDGEVVAKRASLVLQWMQTQDAEIVVTEHCPDKIGATMLTIPSGARCLQKTAFSALDQHSVQVIAPADQVIVFGMETHVCVLQTVLDLVASGKQVFVVNDLSSSTNRFDQQIAIARMQSHGVIILSSEMLLFEWVRGAEDEGFKSMLALVKQLRSQKVLR